MGHLVIPRHVFANFARSHMWVQYKKHPKYWLMVSACLIAAPSCAISTAVQKMTRYDFLVDRANSSLMKDDAKYEKYLRGQ